jgi:branched-chain amino acid aminotransferase
MAKATGGYLNGQLIKMEAVLSGYTEGIALDEAGLISEGSGENVFLVRDGVLMTPPVVSSILPGITRDTVLTLAREAGIPVTEERMPRGMLYTADEAFFTGTAAEVTPIRSVDRIPVGDGKPGPITRQLLEAYMETVSGKRPNTHDWLTYVESAGSTVSAQSAEATT